MLKCEILLTCTPPAVLETPLLLSASNLGTGGAQSVSDITASTNSMPEQELKGTD